MTEAISLTTSAKKINALAAEAGAYIVSQASRLIDGTAEDVISELSWVNAGATHTLMGTQVTPYRGNFSTVKPMNRFVLIRSQPGNEAHVQRLAAAVRTAMGDRDVVAADGGLGDTLVGQPGLFGGDEGGLDLVGLLEKYLTRMMRNRAVYHALEEASLIEIGISQAVVREGPLM